MRGLVLVAWGAALGCSAAAPVQVGAESCSSGPVTLWLDFEGAGVVHAATDNSAAMPVESRLAPSSAVIAPFDGSTIAPRVTRDAAIAAVVDRVRTLLGPYAVDVTTTRPAAPPYARILVGGTDAALGVASMEAGLAAVDCGNLIADDVAYDFAAAQTPDYGGVVGIANTAAHEAGHMFGLEHVDDPYDVMYAAATPMLTLPDLFTLDFGSANFSSYGSNGRQCTTSDPVDEPMLLGCNVGLRPAGGDTTPPTLSWDPPAGDVPTQLTITADASDDVGVARVEVYKNLELVAALDAPPYSATVEAAPGERFYVTVEAIDAAANRTTITHALTAASATMGGPGGAVDGGTPLPDAGPAITPASPSGGCSLGGTAAASPGAAALLLLALVALRARRRSSATG